MSIIRCNGLVFATLYCVPAAASLQSCLQVYGAMSLPHLNWFKEAAVIFQKISAALRVGMRGKVWKQTRETRRLSGVTTASEKIRSEPGGKPKGLHTMPSYTFGVFLLLPGP
jgi:hypothetical protein